MFTREKEREFIEIAELVVAGVKAEMKKQSITQKKMAGIWSVSEPTISKKLAGWRRTTLVDLLKFCDILNISPAVLFPGGTEYTVHNISIGELIKIAVKREVTKLFKEREWVE